jgi:hypothetical protein
MERKEDHPSLRWTEIAAELGYFDQAHLVRDSKALAGDSAGRLLEQILAAGETTEMSQIS